jgi:O-antigen/teichoic acid export membrane protein
MFSFFKKNIYKDSFLNIVASLILTIAVQLLAYPFLGRQFSASEYGLILTIMGVVNAVGVSLGNSLNNTRILLQTDYEKRGFNGDFNPIFVGISIVGAITVALIISIVTKKIDVIVIGCIIITTLILIRAYYSASFRININYKKILISNVFGFIGYIFGIIITFFTGYWVFLFIFGELFSCIYILKSSQIVRDNFQKTPLFNKSFQKFLYIMSASVLSTMMMYMDRFYIYPFLGAEEVSAYTVASYLGKTAGIIFIPIAGVLLTYYAKEDKITIRDFYKRTSFFVVSSFLLYLGIIVLGIPITKLLYPTIFSNALPYFNIANLAAIVFILGNTIQPTLLRFCDAKWLPITQSIYFLVYLILGYFGMIHFGLLGFCYAILVSNILKIILMLLIVTVSLYKSN